MGKKRRTHAVLSVLVIMVLIIGMIPGLASADTSDGSTWLAWLSFATSADSTLIAGETDNINVQLWDNNSNPFSGSVASATITGSDGVSKIYQISGNSGDYTISNVTLETAGDYQLVIRQGAIGTAFASGTITVLDAKTLITDPLYINTNNTVRVKVTDADGNPLMRKSGTVDGSLVGASTVSYTTLSDGTFTFSMTPTLYGNVNIDYAGHIIGTIPVQPAYSQSTRIGGTSSDNVSLAISVAQSGWTAGAQNVILTRDDQFSDALAAAPLSKKLDAPILMTSSSKLDDRTLTELQSLGAKNVYIIGGTVAVSQGIQDSLSGEFTVTRIAGQQAYDTAAQISANVGIDPTQTVYIANAYAIPDAIAISAFAAEQGSPILLTEQNSVPASTAQALANLKAGNVILLGGTAVIDSSVENELSSKYHVKRWGGFDRYDTENIIFQNLFNTDTPQSPIYFTSGLVRQDDVSSGEPKADALVTAALAAKQGGFVVMLPQNSLPSSLNYFLLFNKGYIKQTSVIGNNNSISLDLESQLKQMLVH
ncbi:cell wall-binding repeat-containing protein [Desulfosporosinus sp. PR]|uniref:cell wall-binding repeat-containing protein n=1 Tax=Candidatus Desulfosporosinus nitrosoreducens TaxID=3401928 RepID=UPI0027F0C49D|nr:cell wall-binding repeat-containing protein [Desulfosporosinus sp. PR]MDQ7093902.1 cell wall-binding repeat-containing protein [Desulfosporosinus sp. PR]